MNLLNKIKVADSRTKIAQKVGETNRKAKQLRDGYAASNFKQRQYSRNIIRTKHR